MAIRLTVRALAVRLCSSKSPRLSVSADEKILLRGCDVTAHQLVQQHFTFYDSEDQKTKKDPPLWTCHSLCDDTDDDKIDDENPLGFIHGPWQKDTHVTCRQRKGADRVYSLPSYLNRKFQEAGMPSQSKS